MGGLISSPKPRGPSEAELAAQAAEKKRLADERKKAENEAERSRQERLASSRARGSGQTGRRSLISGSELGSTDTLG